MIIQNFAELATSKKKKDCLQILEAGIQAAAPENIIPEFVTSNQIQINDKVFDVKKYSDIYTVAFGKAADSMTRVFNGIIPVKSGIVVIPKKTKSQIKGKKFQIFNSRHPKPDQSSVKAAKEVMKFIQNRHEGELVVFLVSGGASSLLAMPDGITLDDKMYMTDILLKSDMKIQELNCVRKHLSKIKGGKLVENIKCDGVALILSDVQNDDLSTIASGTTYADNTTYKDALDILEKYQLQKKTPDEVLTVLKNGQIKQSKKSKIWVENCVIANNQKCLKAMQDKAHDLGYDTSAIQVFGNIKDAVTLILQHVSENQKTSLIFGGETTLNVIGKGTGGRNQELVLRLLKNTQKLGKKVIASMGTDGIDGNSVFAGAITENIKMDSQTIKEFLKNSDSGRFFQKQKGNILTGPTHTNMMDIGIVLN